MMILGLLQNQWFKDPERAKKILARYEASGDGRETFVRDMLFLGCLTGKRIRAAFGAFAQIIWEDASPMICGHASACPPADPAHVLRVLEKHKPELVICFGAVAFKAVMGADWFTVKRSVHFRLITCPHPASRGPNVITDLQATAKDVREALASPAPQMPTGNGGHDDGSRKEVSR